MLRVVEKPTKENEELRTELLQRGALKMLHEALEAEVDEYLRRHRTSGMNGAGHRWSATERPPLVSSSPGSGTLAVRAPRVNDRRVDADGHRQRFTSQILPSYMRRAPKVTEVLPILYLRGLSPPRATQGSPASRAVSFRACDGSPRGADPRLAMALWAVWPSASLNGVGAPECLLSRLNTVPARAPLNASLAPSRAPAHDSGSSWVASPSM